MFALRRSSLVWLVGLAAACDDERPDAPQTLDASATPAPSTPVDAHVDASASDAAAMSSDPAQEPGAVIARLPARDTVEAFYLSQTGLYRDIRQKTLSANAVEFTPSYPLWSDGAEKRRWLILPAGSRIDTSDPERWRFPVGTLAFKEFKLGDRRLETRLIARTGAGDDDVWMGAFVWNADESDARFEPKGASNVQDTQHDVPTTRNCETCHRGDPTRLLGLTAIQRPTLPTALFSTQIPLFTAPGDPREAAALGYLHGNCAPCHNPSGSARPDTDLDLRLRLSDRTPHDALAYTSTVGVALQYFGAAPGTMRVVPGAADRSALLLRMRERGNKTQMPPIASEQVDLQGSATIQAWIEGLAGAQAGR